MVDCRAKFQTDHGPFGRVEAAVKWKLDKGGLLGDAFQKDHGPLGHRERDVGGLETR